jgi:hypothetical protein
LDALEDMPIKGAGNKGYTFDDPAD